MYFNYDLYICPVLCRTSICISPFVLNKGLRIDFWNIQKNVFSLRFYLEINMHKAVFGDFKILCFENLSPTPYPTGMKLTMQTFFASGNIV